MAKVRGILFSLLFLLLTLSLLRQTPLVAAPQVLRADISAYDLVTQHPSIADLLRARPNDLPEEGGNEGGDLPLDGEKDPNAPFPLGYQFDGNDFFSLVFKENMVLNLNGLELDPITQNTVIRIQKVPLDPPLEEEIPEESPLPTESPMATPTASPEATPTASPEPQEKMDMSDGEKFYVGIKTSGLGHYEIRFGDYDPLAYRLTLSMKLSEGEKVVELEPNDRLILSVQYMEAVVFEGDSEPSPGVHPKEQIPIGNPHVVYVAAMTGDMIIEARMRPDLFVPAEEAPPETTIPSPGGESNTAGPELGTPAAKGTPPTETVNPDVFAPTGGLGGGGCSLRRY